MNDVTCAEVRDAAAEFALGILPGEERAPVAAHLLRCRECRQEVEEMGRVGDDLLDLIPDAEPPLGFDRQVLSTVQPRRFRPTRRWIAAAAAGVVAAAGMAAGLILANGSRGHPQDVTATLVADGRPIGSVYTEGRPPWVSMTVNHAPVSGRVTCDLIEADQSVVPLGSFDLVNGSGSWGAPEPAGTGRVVGARLVYSGQVIAVAHFGA